MLNNLTQYIAYFPQLNCLGKYNNIDEILKVDQNILVNDLDIIQIFGEPNSNL